MIGILFVRGMKDKSSLPPRTPTNGERLASYRAKLGKEQPNSIRWPWHKY